MTQLQIRYGDGRTVSVPLDGDEWLIGRDAGCEVCLDDAVASRRHARLYRDHRGAMWIQDLQSKNGTLLNERAITQSPVKNFDRIGIGGCEIRLSIPDSPSVVLQENRQDAEFASTNVWGREERVTLAQRRLESLYELNERLTGIFERDELLTELIDICVDHLRFERAGAAVWSGEASQPPQWVLIRNLRGEADAEIRLSRSIIDRTLHHGERILITDTAGADFDPTASMIASQIRSAMCVPMEYLQGVRGVLYGDRVTSAGGYTKEDIDFFAALGRLGAMGLANVRLVDEMKQRQRIETQLQLAREIQSQLFPSQPLRLPKVSIDALNDPGQRVSGDYYDFFVRPDGLIAIVVADVSGKGPPAAMLMANLQAAVHVTMMQDADLVKTIVGLNKLICRNVRDSKFITGIFGLLDPATGKFTYVNAGHMGPYIIRGETVERILVDDARLPLGIEPDEAYQAATIDCSRTPLTLLLYTDGVPDAENPTGEQFGEARLAEQLAACRSEAPDEVILRVRRSIKQFVRNHPQTDDITIVAVRLT